jgi:hypothetical protein
MLRVVNYRNFVLIDNHVNQAPKRAIYNSAGCSETKPCVAIMHIKPMQIQMLLTINSTMHRNVQHILIEHPSNSLYNNPLVNQPI